MSFLAEGAPLLERLAFASVFLGLIVWLVLMPKSLLQAGHDPTQSASGSKREPGLSPSQSFN